ncbi:CPBP family intramembrane metalloprotease [Ochrobactrum sp. CM-21-5]|nr:CPBP family intramembrane glutamic endopeptidase [Ochrobactrum sp. CM-21-5]MBC2885365.1 CPBP family intramembrane metalloprotease [Ochrobactrum sp. CM-21-5]
MADFFVLPLYGLPYLFLAATTISLMCGIRNLSVFAIALSLVTAFQSGVVNIIGLLTLGVFLLLSLWHFSLRHEKTVFRFPGATMISAVLIVAAAIAFFSHSVPGFHNIKVIDHVVMSPVAIPFTMYLNFDKVAAAVILALCGGFFSSANGQAALYKLADLKNLLKWVFLIWAGCSVTLIAAGLSVGYIAFDPKIMPYFWIWTANNFLFVAFAEETLFRGMIQGSLSKAFARFGWSPYTALAASAVLFGLSHIYGGWTYVVLATVAGLFYGMAYLRTGLLIAPVLVHFLLNLTHALLFSYPALSGR